MRSKLGMGQKRGWLFFSSSGSGRKRTGQGNHGGSYRGPKKERRNPPILLKDVGRIGVIKEVLEKNKFRSTREGILIFTTGSKAYRHTLRTVEACGARAYAPRGKAAQNGCQRNTGGNRGQSGKRGLDRARVQNRFGGQAKKRRQQPIRHGDSNVGKIRVRA